MKAKIILGTVQLGIPYGINNSIGKPSREVAHATLNQAFDHGIRILDTADAYGEALEIIGQFHRKFLKKFKVINKFKLDGKPLEEKLTQCLELLELHNLHCYMYHSFLDYQAGQFSKELRALKQRGLIELMGVSIYDINQLAVVTSDPEVDVIQLPVNILDLNLEKEKLILAARAQGKEIHARSIYLQGLLLRDPSLLSGNLMAMKTYLDNFSSLCNRLHIQKQKVALSYVLQKDFINYAVLGIDSPQQLEENMKIIEDLVEEPLQTIAVEDEHVILLNPSNWKP